MQFSNRDILKTIIARSLKLGQLMISRLPVDFFFKLNVFELLLFANLNFENL